MTFEEARAKHLADLDRYYQNLRAMVADPTWCNEAYPRYKECVDAMSHGLKRICRLNNAQVEVS